MQLEWLKAKLWCVSLKIKETFPSVLLNDENIAVPAGGALFQSPVEKQTDGCKQKWHPSIPQVTACFRNTQIFAMCNKKNFAQRINSLSDYQGYIMLELF